MQVPGSLAASGTVAPNQAVPSPRQLPPLPPTPAVNGPSWDPSTSTSIIRSAGPSAAPSAAPSSDLPRTPRAAWSQSSKSWSNTLGTNDASIFRAGTTGARSKGVRSRAVSVLSNVISGLAGRTASVRGGDTSRSLAQTATVDRSVVESVLDAMSATGMPFLMKYVLDGAPRYRNGSRGLVQFAKNRLNGDKVAIKFFLDENAFRCEEAAYAQPELKPLMDSLLVMNSNDAKVQLCRHPAACCVLSTPHLRVSVAVLLTLVMHGSVAVPSSAVLLVVHCALRPCASAGRGSRAYAVCTARRLDIQGRPVHVNSPRVHARDMLPDWVPSPHMARLALVACIS